MAKLRKDDENQLQAPPVRANHPLIDGSAPMGLISAENPRFPVQTPGGHDSLGQQIQQMGLKAVPREGYYDAPEKSWMVYSPTREQLYQLGRAYGQESVLYTNGGKHELIYTNGPNTGRYSPGAGHTFHEGEAPENYYTKMPELGGHIQLHVDFDPDKIRDSMLQQPQAIDALQARAQHGAAAPPQPRQQAEDPSQGVTKAEIRAGLLKSLKKAISIVNRLPDSPMPLPHPHAYQWHDGHTKHHKQVMAPGVVGVDLDDDLQKADPHPTNDQAAGAGVSTYAKYALPYGKIDKNKPSSLIYYPYHGKAAAVNQLVKDHGYNTYYAGGKLGRPDLANRNYNTKHLMIYDPSPTSGASGFGPGSHGEYTDNWRKVHELAHALTYPELNTVYGEGRRIGALGKHRSQTEAMRAVHWEHLAAHKQRELSKQLGIHISDSDFNKEYNTVMHDAVHRAITGKFTEPSEEGFIPHEHQIPLEHALSQVREAASNLGIGEHDLIKKGEHAMSDEKTHEWNETRQLLAKAIKERVDRYSREMLELRKRELKKNGAEMLAMADHGPAPEIKPADLCPTCGKDDKPGSCICLSRTAMKSEMFGQSEDVEKHAADGDPGKPAVKKNGDAEGTGDLAGIAGGGEMAGAVPMVAAEKKDSKKCRDCGARIKPEAGLNYCDKCQSKRDRAEKPTEKNELATGKPKDMPATGKPVNKNDAPALAASDMDKTELKTKAKEPVKPAPGNGVKIKALAKVAMSGMGKMPKEAQQQASFDASKAAHTAAAPGAAKPAIKLPGQAAQAQRQNDLSSFMPAGKFTGAGAALPGAAAPKPMAPAGPGIKLPGAGMAKPAGAAPAPALPTTKPGLPPGGTAHLQAPPAPVAKPAAPMAMGGGAPKPMAAPKLPGAGMKSAAPAAQPKPSAGPPAPKQPKPDAAAKSQKDNDNLKKNGK